MINMNKAYIKKLSLIFMFIVIVSINYNKIFAEVDAYCMNPAEGCTDIRFITTANPSSRSESYYDEKPTFFLYDKAGEGYNKFFDKTINKLAYTESFTRSDTVSKDEFNLNAKYETCTKINNFSSVSSTGKEKTYDQVVAKDSTNSIFYNALPENVYKLDSTYNKTTNGTTYAIKMAKSPITETTKYIGLYKKTEVGYKIVGGTYYSFNKLSSDAASDIKTYCKTSTPKGYAYVAYISKVLAIRDKDGNFLTNIDNAAKAHDATRDNWGGVSYAYDDMFNIKYNFNMPVNKTVYILYKYRNEKTGEFESDTDKTKILTCEINQEISIDPNEAIKKEKGDYKYIGFKVISGDNLDEDVSNTKLLSSTNDGGFKVNSGVKITKDSKDTTVIAYYYDKRQVEINHVLVDSSGNSVTLKTDKDGNVTNSVINIPLGTNYTVNYLGDKYTYKYNGKTYDFISGSGSKWVADTLTLARDERKNGSTTSTWGSNYKKTTLQAVNYGGDEKGETFTLSHGVVIEFRYKEGTIGSLGRLVYIRHVDQNGNPIDTNATEKINNEIFKNGYNSYAGVQEDPVSDKIENFTIKGTDAMKINKLVNLNTSVYTYKGYKVGNGASPNEASSKRDRASLNTGATPYNLAASSSINYTYIDFIYNRNVPCTPGVDCPDPIIGTTPTEETISLVGTLAYVNNPADYSSSAYSSSTSSESIDYIASSKSLKAYISGAYPYYFRRADFEKLNSTGTQSASITVNVKGTVSGWTHDNCYHNAYRGHPHEDPIYSDWTTSTSTTSTSWWTNTKGQSGGTTPSAKISTLSKSEELSIVTASQGATSHTSRTSGTGRNRVTTTTYTATINVTTKTRTITGWKKTCVAYSATPTSSKTLTYTVPYKHIYYHIKNFKMYRISKVQVFDSMITNTGGKLFSPLLEDESTYTLTPSSNYESRLSGGFTDHTTSTSFPGYTYSLSDQASVSCDGTTDCNDKTSAMQNTLNRRINNVTPAQASEVDSEHYLKFTLSGTNETFNLVYKPDLFDKNYSTYTWHITSLTNETRVLDTTQLGNYAYNKEQYQTVSNNTTNVSDFNDNPILNIPISQVNGIRVTSGRIYYDIDNASNRNRNEGETSLYVGENRYITQVHDYTGNNVNKVNVLTPLKTNVSIKTDQIVNHSNSADIITLQKNATFTVTPSVSSSSVAGYGNVDTNEFLKYYYVKFDFDITDVQVFGDKTEQQGYDVYSSNEIIQKGVWLKVPAGGYLTAKATQYTETQGSTVSRFTNTVYAVAVAKNIPSLLEQEIYNNLQNRSSYVAAFDNYSDNGEIAQYTGSSLRQSQYYTIQSIVSDAYHMAKASVSTSNLGRIFDFKLTDCSDLNFKDVFRKSTSTNVNTPTGTVYFSGVRRLKMYDSSSDVGYNETEEVSNRKTILPLGPYKNTNASIIEAPKLGYRIAFDLKTTGFISNFSITSGSRYVYITPSYYYISKDGTVYDPNITIYYKNSSGKYVPFVNSGYSIYFKPNDGYRNLSNASITPNSEFLSTKLEKLEISSPSGFKLTSQMMDTSGSGDNFIQAWYGEFKLPNSTIAISSGGNLNNPKTDGYIGVKFKIDCYDEIDSKKVIVSYNQDDKSTSPNTNTTQWDYDGYLGFANPGQLASNLKLVLEKATKTLDNTMYNNIKGTVVLYDTDSRAAEDFE